MGKSDVGSINRACREKSSDGGLRRIESMLAKKFTWEYYGTMVFLTTNGN
jgi:hypothetical protein